MAVEAGVPPPTQKLSVAEASTQAPPGWEDFSILLMPGAAMVIREITTWVMPMAAAL